MRPSELGLVRGSCLLLIVVLPVGLMAQDLRSTSRVVPAAATSSPKSVPWSVPPMPTQPLAAHSGSLAELPDSPGTEWAKMQSASQDGNTSQRQSTPAQQPNSGSQNQAPQRPLGTAAAEAPKVAGITAAEPAGVAIAPAKQRRVRTIVLKVGAILGAGAALGAVIALSEGTSSKPPGAH